MNFLIFRLRGFILPIILASLSFSCGFPGTVSDSIENTLSPPEADVFPKALIAKESQTVKVKATVKLDGSPSYDPQQENLTFVWTLNEIPNGSAATLSSTSTAITSFTADKGGYYTATLQVTNTSSKVSGIRTATVDAVGTGANHPPVAIAGADQTVSISTTGVAQLAGDASHDADGDNLTFRWSLLGVPAAATGGPSDTTYTFLAANTARAALYPFVAGIYTVELQVSDGIDTDYDEIIVTAE